MNFKNYFLMNEIPYIDTTHLNVKTNSDTFDFEMERFAKDDQTVFSNMIHYFRDLYHNLPKKDKHGDIIEFKDNEDFKKFLISNKRHHEADYILNIISNFHGKRLGLKRNKIFYKLTEREQFNLLKHFFKLIERPVKQKRK